MESEHSLTEIKVSTGRQFHLKAWRGEVCSQLTGMLVGWRTSVPCWLSTGGFFRFSQCETACRAVHNMEAGLHLSEHVRELERQAREEPDSFYNLSFEVASRCFCHILFNRKKSPALATLKGRELYKGTSTRKLDGPLGAISGAASCRQAYLRTSLMPLLHMTMFDLGQSPAWSSSCLCLPWLSQIMHLAPEAGTWKPVLLWPFGLSWHVTSAPLHLYVFVGHFSALLVSAHGPIS